MIECFEGFTSFLLVKASGGSPKGGGNFAPLLQHCHLSGRPVKHHLKEGEEESRQ